MVYKAGGLPVSRACMVEAIKLARVRASGAWQVMRRGPHHLDVPQMGHAPDYARCVGHLLDDVAAVEHSRRSREVIDLWAWMKT